MLPGWKQGYSGENVPRSASYVWSSSLLVQRSRQRGECRLQVEGLTGALQKNVRAQLSTIESDEVTPDRRFRARVDDAIREGLKALGYYEPTIELNFARRLRKVRGADCPRLAGRAGKNWRHRRGAARWSA